MHMASSTQKRAISQSGTVVHTFAQFRYGYRLRTLCGVHMTPYRPDNMAEKVKSGEWTLCESCEAKRS
jgi:hypothetical protein